MDVANRSMAVGLGSQQAWAMVEFAEAPLGDQRLKKGW